jgi:hypothetical protein
MCVKAGAVGSVVRASVSHTEGHRFKSCTAHHNKEERREWHMMVMTEVGCLALAES